MTDVTVEMAVTNVTGVTDEMDVIMVVTVVWL